VSLADAILAVMWAALSAYAVLGGADFGGGILDLLARGERGARQREAISKAMAPVWEANHVWLIFFLTGLFTAFPRAFAALGMALYVPITLALAGIVLRGAAFAFRSHVEGADRARSTLGAVFGGASAITPALFGAAAGALATGQIAYRDGDVRTQGALDWWLAPLPLASGALALAVCAYLAAAFLCAETARAHQERLTEDFRARALVAAMVAGALSLFALPIAAAEAPRLEDRLLGPALPLVVGGVGAGAGSLAALWRRRYRLARGAATAAVAAVIWGWGIAQYPQLAGPDVTVSSAAAPEATLRALAIGGGLGAVLLAPALWALYVAYRRRAPVKVDDG
jgi:cytochrome d ubiquinol oxidase subunit II